MSSDYGRHLEATRRVWSAPMLVETAGVFIFLTYLTVPVLVSVRSASGAPARSALDGEREREFLLRLLGFTEKPRWQGGIRNTHVQRHATLLYEQHTAYFGMRSEYLDFMAAVIALAPLRVRELMDSPANELDRSGYWSYVSTAMSLFDSEIGSEPEARKMCLGFIDAYAGPSAEGRQLLTSLRTRHPEYVQRATPLLFARARSVIDALTGEN